MHCFSPVSLGCLAAAAEAGARQGADRVHGRMRFRVEVCAEPSFSDPTRTGKVTRHTVVT